MSELGPLAPAELWCLSIPAIKNGLDFRGLKIPVSHNSMRGGKYHVQDENLNNFYGHLAETWHLPPTYLSEIATPSGPHRLFFDLDIYVTSETPWTPEHTTNTVAFLLMQLRPLIKEKDKFECIVTQAEPQNIPVEGADDKIKVGIHMFLPYIFVSIEDHVAIRAVLLCSMVKQSSDHIGLSSDNPGCLLVTPLSQVLDKAVCQVPQLRMICSNKCGKCNHTKKERVELKCNRKNHKLNRGRMYQVVDVMDINEDGELVRDDQRIAQFSNLDQDASTLDRAESRKLVSFCLSVCL
jgi:hypothetical protein